MDIQEIFDEIEVLPSFVLNWRLSVSKSDTMVFKIRGQDGGVNHVAITLKEGDDYNTLLTKLYKEYNDGNEED